MASRTRIEKVKPTLWQRAFIWLGCLCGLYVLTVLVAWGCAISIRWQEPERSRSWGHYYPYGGWDLEFYPYRGAYVLRAVQYDDGQDFWITIYRMESGSRPFRGGINGGGTYGFRQHMYVFYTKEEGVPKQAKVWDLGKCLGSYRSYYVEAFCGWPWYAFSCIELDHQVVGGLRLVKEDSSTWPRRAAVYLSMKPYWPAIFANMGVYGAILLSVYILIRHTKPSLSYVIHYRSRRRIAQGRCVRCGYDLTGLTSDCCPECGAEFRAT